LGKLRPGAPVNLERALPANGRLGGHFVQGHVDCAATVAAYEKIGDDYRLEITLPGEFAHYIAFKGSITVNGVSLTVAEKHVGSFVCWIIPGTRKLTNLRGLQNGDWVNLEFDVLAKYLEAQLGRYQQPEE
ncbi:MAG: riboflavin synthase, partial [Verrucomicrobia bacterium]|nr:riboflavin synthase [Verrucomicrobiota bacterium]